MKSIDRIDINRKWQRPGWVPMLLLLCAFAGFLIGKCNHQAQKEYILFSDIELQSVTHSNIDVAFIAKNRTKINYENKAILIKVFDLNNEEIASKITTIALGAGEQKRFLKVLTKLRIPITGADDIAGVTVEKYHPGLFN
ncbi:MAG: hypothetical protein K9N06_07895 [Candidatus Cloacimonetes bacterium]|nr:hypothetical protein [Candidatus Cloacimonadota bacterium]